MSASDSTEGKPAKSAISSQELKESFRHMDALFALAQVLTLDAEKASRLVEATYLHAYNQVDRDRLAIEDRRFLLQLLLQIHQRQNEIPRQLFVAESENEPATSLTPSQESFRQRLLDQFLKQAVPVAFATMTDADRVLLTLCDVERLSCADAALILSRDSDTVCDQLQNARIKLQQIVIDNASPAEKRLLLQTDTREWIPTTLRRTVKSDFTALPPTLEPRIKSALVKNKKPQTDHSPAPNAPTRNKSALGSGNRMTRGVITILLILGTGLIGYLGSAVLTREPDSNLVTLSASKAQRVEPLLATSDLDEAEQFVRQQMNWRLHLPEITECSLTGVGINEIARGVRVPVFLYKDQQAEEDITVYAFTYALLDQYGDRIELGNDVLTAIANENQFDLHELGDEQQVLIWRQSDDIFMAVTSSNAGALRERIHYR